MISLSLFSTIFAVCLSVTAASDDTISLGGGDCIGGTSGSKCIREWTFSGGPGWTGQRATTSGSNRSRMICSPSCQRYGTNTDECLLIVALHGIYSNPNDQQWLMLGSIGPEAFSESATDGGPFCISFHKSKNYPWEYNCSGDDAAHLAAFMEYIVDEFPIDRKAINLHGFSSGAVQTNNLMLTGCPVERLVSAASPYGGGWLMSPPTTKAAYLLAHGTHDNIVPYQFLWDPSRGFATPSCECNGALPVGSVDTCSNHPFSVPLQAERMAAAMATLRGGYDGGVWGEMPEPVSTLDLINDNDCELVKDSCISVVASPPNPWNEDVDCSTLGTNETDVIEYPINDDGGPIKVLRMNIHNHDYPNKRRGTYGAAEYFFYMKKFFNENRGLNLGWGYRSIERIDNRQCLGPVWYNAHTTDPLSITYRNSTFEGVDFVAEDCGNWCREEKRCVEAFYYTYNAGSTKTCHIHYELSPCTNVQAYSAGVRFVATTQPLSPTMAPSPSPSSSGLPSSIGPCESWWYALMLFRFVHATTQPLSPTMAPSPSPSSSGLPSSIGQCESWSLCPVCGTIDSSALAGYSCLDSNGNSVADSNFGYTEAACLGIGPDYTWVSYTCDIADDYLQGVSDEERPYFLEVWQPKCCNSGPQPTTSPTVTSPPSTCPEECAAPDCFFAGKPGPSWWPPEWVGDPNGSPTEDGFCTKFCNEYDPNSNPGKRVCSSTLWDTNGIDCTPCTALVNAPPLPIDERLPSSGLCSTTDDLSGHLLWGKGVRECNTGREPTNDARCTVYQGFNGDEIINPERNCDSFCTHFGLFCINGYDDGEDGCVYGGQGIGCFDRLGVGSIGGPTPDHVCVCGPLLSNSPTATPVSTKAPVSDPTKAPAPDPTKDEAPVPDPTKAPAPDPTKAPVPDPTKAPVPVPTKAPVPVPTQVPVQNPTKAPTDVTSCGKKKLLEVYMNTDNNGGENRIFVKKQKKNGKGWSKKKIVNEENFPSNKLTKIEKCLTKSKCYQVQITDSGKDGICCENGKGSVRILWDGTEVVDIKFKNGKAKKVNVNCDN
eukprot:CAMPEP_0198276148 /NCGR_PEP_ID=MMETSP1447-20131203/65154_1 /TAXON_ID=420782 /ORGANISM="Chaetoceros dichaeta, Strain CCMP1751" /LENGTH=1050 /DNA_ID=CAMNT_0043971071 /DNA_START=60 /DNA_END=3213 /DNA_ORIENTATION=-